MLCFLAFVALLAAAVLGEQEDIAASNKNRYPHLSYEEINQAMVDLALRFPRFARLSTAQQEFNLPSPGHCGSSGPCLTQILHLTNFDTLGMETNRVEVYISGALHGNERVGPHAALELARVLLELSSENAWLQHLLHTRSIFITPLTNALGYFTNERGENGIDTNRDYPIDQSAEQCMQTVCSRIVNELFRAHLFQIAITFHGGMEAIALEWGTTSRKSRGEHASPDDFALLQLGHGLAAFAGRERANKAPYPVGRMNDLVYPVPGGMEDWAYAGNWDPQSTRTACRPNTFGGYAEHKTRYTDAMLRIVNVLVETSDAKSPNSLGERSGEILNPHSLTGHVPRNVRLALMLIDIAEPYVVITNLSWEDSVTLRVEWEVGGAFQVDETQAVLELEDGNGTKQVWPSPVIYQRDTRWKTNAYSDRGRHPFKSAFSSCFRFPRNGNTMGMRISIRARVDSTWNATGRVSPAGFAPQSHWVNARTNPNWDMENAGRRVRGRLDWYSRRAEIPANSNSSAPSSLGRRLLEGACVMVGSEEQTLGFGLVVAILAAGLCMTSTLVLFFRRQCRERRQQEQDGFTPIRSMEV